MKKTNKNANMGIALGMCFGVSVGSVLGLSFGNISMGIPLGLCICMTIGVLLGAQKDKAINKQVEEEGYTIKEIKKNEQNEEYIITIENRLGKQHVVFVSKGQMKEESFAIDDVVFLDDGLIEQAYDKTIILKP